MVSIREIAEHLCRGIENNDEYLVEGIIEDKITVLKLVCCAQCPRVEGNYDYNWTPVHCAARWGRTLFLEQIFRAGGAPVDIRDERRRTPLWYAVQCGHLNTAVILMNAGATRNSPDRNGWTPLHAAARAGQSKCCKSLVENGASRDAQDKKGWSALHKGTFPNRS